MTRYSKTLVYAPEVQVYVATDNGVLDLSPDIVNGQVRRVVNGVSQFSCVLNNRNRKYIGAMKRMDRIVVFMKRVSSPIQVFAGYLDQVPAAGLYVSTVSIRASCTLKRLMYTYWDPGLPASKELMMQELYKNADPEKNPQVDTGLGAMMANVLSKVGGWNRDDIHIGTISTGFFNMALQAAQAETNIDALNKFLSLLGFQSDASGLGQPTAPTSYLNAKVLPPANERRGSSGSYTIQDLVSICRAAGFVGEGAATAAAIAFATTHGFYKTVKEIGGVTKYGLWQLDKFDAPSLVPASALDPLACAKLYYQLTVNGTDFKISPQYNTGAYKQYMQAAKAAVNGPDSNILISGSANATTTTSGSKVVTPGDATSFPASTAAGNDAYFSGQTATVPAYGTNPTTDQMKSIYGSTEEEVKANLVTINFQGHQVQVHKKAENAFRAVDAQITALNSGYQVRLIGTFDWRVKNNGSNTNELSLHSFGIAMDINWDTNGFGKGGVGPSGKHDIPDTWIQIFKRNGFGWGGDWSGGPEDKDYMHFQYQGGGTYSMSGIATSGTFGQNAFQSGIFKFLFRGADGVSEEASVSLVGDRAPINDQQLLPTIQAISSSSLRNFMSGPDGSFIAFFPDYFGIYGTSPKLILEDIELMDFRVDASDDNLTTDVFVAGTPSSGGAYGGSGVSLQDWFETSGIVNIRKRDDMLYALGIDIENDPDFNPASIYQRFGLRPLKAEYPSVGSHLFEKSQALLLFIQKWAQQYSTPVQFTFMPELYPGMRILIKSHQMTVYVEEVVHTFGYNTGFSTTATISAPASVGTRSGSLVLPIGRV